jgi:CheY-like chemotaxis protein
MGEQFRGQQFKPGLKILMADDSPEDRFFVQRALDKSGVGSFFFGVSDGQEAINYLCRVAPYTSLEQFAFPNVLLLDLKMPKVNGFDVLKWLHVHPQCRVIPTIIYSSSGEETDVHNAYVLGANSYMVKPISSEELVEQIQTLYKYWSQCQTPTPPPSERCDPALVDKTPGCNAQPD